MTYEDIQNTFQEIDFPVENFTALVKESKKVRDQLIQNLLQETHINVYYRSYYLIDAVSKTNPELFYEYWDSLFTLRFHKNSYHRNIFHWIITNLIPLDEEHKFDKIKDEYFAQVKDVKVLTGLEAVKDIIRMSVYRPDLEAEIINLLLNQDLLADYTEKQKDRFHYYSMEYFDTILCKRDDCRLVDFIHSCRYSKNTTTSKKAKELFKKLQGKSST